MYVAALDVLDQAVQGLVHVTIVDRHRVLVTRVRVGPEREHQRVVLDPFAALGLNRLLLGFDPVQLVGDQSRARVARDPLQGVTSGRSVGERLADRHRAVDELRVGRDQGHVGALGSEQR